MVEKLLCVWCAFILVQVVGNIVVWGYTEYVVPCHDIFVFILKQRIRRHTKR
jgi:hypothetical protein